MPSIDATNAVSKGARHRSDAVVSQLIRRTKNSRSLSIAVKSVSGLVDLAQRESAFVSHARIVPEHG
jgi:hypothetical protein